MVIESIYIVLISYYVYATTYNQDVINDFIGVRKAKHVDLYVKWIKKCLIETRRQGITTALLINSKYVSLFYYKITIPYFTDIRKSINKVILHFNEYLCISSILFSYINKSPYIRRVKMKQRSLISLQHNNRHTYTLIIISECIEVSTRVL